MSDSKKTTKRLDPKHEEFSEIWADCKHAMEYWNQQANFQLDPKKLEFIVQQTAWRVFLKMRQQNN